MRRRRGSEIVRDMMSESRAPAVPRGRLRDYYELTKPRVVALLLFTALVGMFLATPGLVPAQVVVLGLLGIGLGAAAGAVINQVIDLAADSVMSRTRRRPLPTGALSVGRALSFGGVLAVASMLVLVFGVNRLTAILTFISMIGYGIVYTAFLKRITPQNIVIGGAAGAAPPLLGWTAVTGSLDAQAFWLFLIVFVWTPPHFWALALYRKTDYARAGVPMLPVTHGRRFTRLQILLYTILLAAVSLMPYVTQMSGTLYLIVAGVLNVLFLRYAWRLYRNYSDLLARRTFLFSIQYLAILFAALLLDHYRNFLTILGGGA